MLDVAVAVVVAAEEVVAVVAMDPGRLRSQDQDQRMAARLWVRTGSVPASEIGLYQAESHRRTVTFHAGVRCS